jgi:uncharacterized protein YecE (DUF72 family)
MQLWIGTSGYSFPDWVGDFYPPGTSANRMFTYYVRQFPLVELNYTFYRPPTPQSLVRLAKRSLPGFQFLVKLHRSLTHEHDLSEGPGFRKAVDALQQENRLLGLLSQHPQQFHCTRTNLDWVDRLADLFAGHTLAVEFRHWTWNRPEVVDWLRQRNLHLVSVDVPAIPALYPAGLVQSSRLIYLRLHSRRRENWYQSDRDRYDYLYSDGELLEWLQALASKEGQADRALMLFNNCHRTQAALNAQRVRELLRHWDSPLQVVDAPTEPVEKGMLF